MIVGVDIGGTFTDFCTLDDAGRVRTHKVRTSAREPLAAVRQGIVELESAPGATVVLATTVAVPALPEQELDDWPLHILQSDGSTISSQAAPPAAAQPQCLGPAAGVLAALDVAQRAGLDRILTLDMGGTATDVTFCFDPTPDTREDSPAGPPLPLSAIDVRTIGPGGGAIARLDAGGMLRVGPESARADPGPLCYGQEQASEITVTDANLVLGRLGAGRFLNGRMPLDAARARSGIQALARRLSLPLEAAAWGVIRVANSSVEGAIRVLAAQAGQQLPDLGLVAYGGAGPLHACELAAALGISRVLIPPHPGVLSAWGVLQASVGIGHGALPPAGSLDPKAAQVGYQQVTFAGDDHPGAARPVPTALYEREGLVTGNMIVGPAIICQPDTTIVIPPNWSATVDGGGNLVARESGS